MTWGCLWFGLKEHVGSGILQLIEMWRMQRTCTWTAVSFLRWQLRESRCQHPFPVSKEKSNYFLAVCPFKNTFLVRWSSVLCSMFYALHVAKCLNRSFKLYCEGLLRVSLFLTIYPVWKIQVTQWIGWCLCDDLSVSPVRPVWSLGEGQLPEDLDKPIDTPPLSTLLIEKPQGGSITVGEWLCIHAFHFRRFFAINKLVDEWKVCVSDLFETPSDSMVHCAVLHMWTRWGHHLCC